MAHLKIFIDSGNLNDIKEAAQWGALDGATTNPSLVAQSSVPHEELIKSICQIVPGPVSAEVLSEQTGSMVEEGLALAAIHPNVVVKLPLTPAGLGACRELSAREVPTNLTLCFSVNQALLAAKSGAHYVSPFVGRLDDQGHRGMDLIQQIKALYDHYDFSTQILVASIRHPDHVKEAALLGAHAATVPFKVFKELAHHPLTDIGLKKFLDDHRRGPRP